MKLNFMYGRAYENVISILIVCLYHSFCLLSVPFECRCASPPGCGRALRLFTVGIFLIFVFSLISFGLKFYWIPDYVQLPLVFLWFMENTNDVFFFCPWENIKAIIYTSLCCVRWWNAPTYHAESVESFSIQFQF